MNTHTPAPWTVAPDPEWPNDYFSVYYDVGGTGAEIAGRIGEPANASLIAAAPELLAALEAFLRAPSIGSSGPGSVSIEVQTFNLNAARAAIAKAKGDANV